MAMPAIPAPASSGAEVDAELAEDQQARRRTKITGRATDREHLADGLGPGRGARVVERRWPAPRRAVADDRDVDRPDAARPRPPDRRRRASRLAIRRQMRMSAIFSGLASRKSAVRARNSLPSVRVEHLLADPRRVGAADVGQRLGVDVRGIGAATPITLALHWRRAAAAR